MLKSYNKKTRKGNVIKTVSEHYLRDDLPNGIGSHLDDPAKTAENENLFYLVPDTNVVIQQIAFLENPKIKNCIILETVLEETKKLDRSIHNRLNEIIQKPEKKFFIFSNEHHKETFVTKSKEESVNDRNDRAIRVATQWYQNLVKKLSKNDQKSTIQVIMLTNDKDSQKKAIEIKINGETCIDFVSNRLKDPILLDFLSQKSSNYVIPSRKNHAGGKKTFFEPYISAKEVEDLMNNPHLSDGKYHIGIFRKTRYANVATVEIKGLKTDQASSGQNSTMYISIKSFQHMNRAVNEDIVVVEIEEDPETAENNKKTQENAPKNLNPPGKVIGIQKRNWRTLCGSLDERTETSSAQGGNASKQRSVLFVPVNSCYPSVRIQTSQANEIITKRIMVQIDTWNEDEMYPRGHLTKILGEIGDINVEDEVTLIENDVPYQEFSKAVLKCLPPDNYEIPKEERKKRLDLTKDPEICVMSVDPVGCTDIDDALHCRLLKKHDYPVDKSEEVVEFFEVGVHIADVSHFVKEDTAIDEEARRRGTSVYLVDRRINMLPQLLTEKLCSLVFGVERFAFSGIYEIKLYTTRLERYLKQKSQREKEKKRCMEAGELYEEPEIEKIKLFEIVNEKYAKSIILSKGSLSYGEAQIMIDDAKDNTQRAVALRNLMKISRALKAERIMAGALQLSSNEVKFNINKETLQPIDVGMYELKDTNSMVEEFMLLGNIKVAEYIYKAFHAAACLRRHPQPNSAKFDSLVKSLTIAVKNDPELNKLLGKFVTENDKDNKASPILDISSSKSFARTIERFVNSKGKPNFNKLVKILSTRCMEQAKYFPAGEFNVEEFFHYGLAISFYTHFTSPIRRYADVIVHRQLAAAIGVAELTPSCTDPKVMHQICENINMRNFKAKQSGRDSVKMYTNIYFKDKEVVEDAYILKVRDNSIGIYVPTYGFEDRIMLDSQSEAYFEKKTEKKEEKPKENNDEAIFEFQLENKKKLEYEFNEAEEIIKFKETGAKLQVFDKIKVRIFTRQLKNHRTKLMFQIVDPKIAKNSIQDKDSTKKRNASDALGDEDTRPSKKQKK